MNPYDKSLLKYDTPVLVSKKSEKQSDKSQSPSKSSPWETKISLATFQQSSDLESKSSSMEVLNSIFPPREWTENNQLWMQHVSSAPCTRAGVITLEEALYASLEKRNARGAGICPIRRELYTQCFDELIRQVTINCAERGLLLVEIRNEINMTIDVYQKLHESSMAFGVRKILQAQKSKVDMEQRLSELENENKDLMKQLNEQKAKCDAMEMKGKEKAQIEEKKHFEEIQLLKQRNQQFKAQLESMARM